MTTKTVLCFGDSNTYGTPPMKSLSDDQRFDERTRWPRLMASLLGDNFRIIEEGLGGRTTVFDDPIEGQNRNGARFLDGLIRSHRPIDLLIIMLGTNDQKKRFDVGAQDIALGAGKLLDIAIHSGFVSQMLLVAPPKVTENGCLAEMFAGAKAKSDVLAKHMNYVAKSRGAAFLDAASHIETDPIDGVHLSAESHKILGKIMATEVQKRVP